MSQKNVYEKNYERLEKLLGKPPSELDAEQVYRFRASGFMDLVVEILLPCPQTGARILSLAHYFEQNGDLCQDPDVTVRVFPPDGDKPGMIEAMTFQQALPPVCQEVYPEPGKINPRLKRELNAFLTTWLNNLKSQGHRLVEPVDEA